MTTKISELKFFKDKAKTSEERMYYNARLRYLKAPENSIDKRIWLHILTELKKLLDKDQKNEVV